MIKATSISNGKVYVTFTFKPETDVEKIELAGSWNNWEKQKLRKKRNGEFYITKLLPAATVYEFKYIIDDNEWLLDDEADTTPNNYGTLNSVITT
jgi:hypothetical protein